MLLQRRIARHGREHSARPDPFYGYHYNPSWPSILSVAHDETNGGQLFVILDRPCSLNAPGTTLPFFVPDTGGPYLSIVSASLVLPIKLRVSFDGPVPQGAAWRWGGGACDLFDPITGNYPNAAGGLCADVPGPFIPPPPPPVPANITSVAGTEGLTSCAVNFDGPVTLAEGAVPDDAITFGGLPAVEVMQLGPQTLGIVIQVPGEIGVTTWEIVQQPDWIVSPVVFPNSGVLVEP